MISLKGNANVLNEMNKSAVCVHVSWREKWKEMVMSCQYRTCDSYDGALETCHVITIYKMRLEKKFSAGTQDGIPFKQYRPG